MIWAKRQADRRQSHLCDSPPIEFDVGDLWRCDDCGQLWRGDYACATCRVMGASRPHGGQHQLGRIWVHAGWWERLRYWRAGRQWVPPTQDAPPAPLPPAEPTR